MSIRPLQGRICVREFKPKQMGHIHLPDDYYDNNIRNTTSHKGVILAMGPPACTPKGVPIPPDFKVGDTVLFVFGMEGSEKSRTSVWSEDGQPCTWVTQEEVIGVFDED